MLLFEEMFVPLCSERWDTLMSTLMSAGFGYDNRSLLFI